MLEDPRVGGGGLLDNLHREASVPSAIGQRDVDSYHDRGRLSLAVRGCFEMVLACVWRPMGNVSLCMVKITRPVYSQTAWTYYIARSVCKEAKRFKELRRSQTALATQDVLACESADAS